MLATAWDTLWAAAAFLATTGSKHDAALWAARAANCVRTALGEDSPEYQQYIAVACTPGADNQCNRRAAGKKKGNGTRAGERRAH